MPNDAGASRCYLTMACRLTCKCMIIRRQRRWLWLKVFRKPQSSSNIWPATLQTNRRHLSIERRDEFTDCDSLRASAAFLGPIGLA